MDATPPSPHPPALVTRQAAVFPGPALPLILPLSLFPPEVRARWLLSRPEISVPDRIEAALTGGLAGDAWDLLRQHGDALLLQPTVERAVLAWIRVEGQRLGLPGDTADCLERQAGRFVASPEECRLAIRDAQAVLGSLPWPRWKGPLLLVPPGDPLLNGAGDLLARPALPVLALDLAGAGRKRDRVAAAITRLALDLTAPPPAGWPAWIRDGSVGVVAAVARGEGPSPRLMQERRQAAGAVRITDLLAGRLTDPDLATAIMAPLLHSRRRDRFANLLDPLRHGSDAWTALRIAYGWDLEDLLNER